MLINVQGILLQRAIAIAATHLPNQPCDDHAMEIAVMIGGPGIVDNLFYIRYANDEHEAPAAEKDVACHYRYHNSRICFSMRIASTSD